MPTPITIIKTRTAEGASRLVSFLLDKKLLAFGLSKEACRSDDPMRYAIPHPDELETSGIRSLFAFKAFWSNLLGGTYVQVYGTRRYIKAQVKRAHRARA